MMTMADAVLIGAIGAVLLCVLTGVLVWAGWQCWKLYGKLEAVSAGLGDVGKELRMATIEISKASAACVVIGSELMYLRTMSQPQDGTMGEGVQDNAPQEPRARPVFPTALYERFQVAPEPDAKMEDTDMELLTQTDEDLMREELNEKLRASGYDPEAEPDGIRVDSE